MTMGRSATLAVTALMLSPGLARPQPELARTQSAEPVYEFRDGRWFDGSGFQERTFYTRYGVLQETRPARVDSVIDLAGGWVIPPLAEAHNHNLEASSRLAGTIRRYLEAGVFYVKNPNARPAGALPIRGLVNRPSSVDVAFAMGGFTGPGGHPVGVVERNLSRGIWSEADGEGAFYYEVESGEDLDRVWAGFLALRPDFVKTYLLHSEEYAQRRDDPEFRGWRGLDPAVLPEIVRRAGEAGLRVATHVETAADFRAAVAAGVDEIAHLPGFRGNESSEFPDPDVFRLTDADAAAAAEEDVVVVTTLGDFAGAAPDSVVAVAESVFRHNLSVLKRHGVRLAVGSDSYDSVGVEEAEQLRELGVFTNLELLKAWVETTPRSIFPTRKIGRLESGWEASFLVLEADPLADPSATGRIALRVKQGLVLDPAVDER